MKAYTRLTRHEGNETLFDVIEMSIISMLWEVPVHFHAEGLRGTGKTTIMRAAQQIMPPIVRIKGCLYNCDPAKPHCPNHKHLSSEEIAALGTETVPRPFLEISHSAKIGTVAGSIDLAKITDPTNPSAAILPGVIPKAHRGVIFVDEINRLADTSPEITDVLLDVMGTKPGRVQIEETGLPMVEIPVEVSVWAASNPDEEPGPLQEIRRQLSDRFDLVVEMGRSRDSEEIADILVQSELRRQGKEDEMINRDVGQLEQKLHKLEAIGEKYVNLTMPDFLRNYIARLYVKHNLESFRAIEAIQHCALLNCALRERDQVLVSDVVKIIPLALKHRVDPETLTKIMSNSNRSGEETVPNRGFSSQEKKNEPTTFSSGSDRSVFLPLRQLFGGKRETQNNELGDPVQASPLNKAKRLHDMNLDELIRSESEMEQ